jgi:hypothetical protein
MHKTDASTLTDCSRHWNPDAWLQSRPSKHRNMKAWQAGASVLTKLPGTRAVARSLQKRKLARRATEDAVRRKKYC